MHCDALLTVPNPALPFLRLSGWDETGAIALAICQYLRRFMKQRPSMSRVKTGKGKRKVRVGEAASRVVVPATHTGSRERGGGRRQTLDRQMPQRERLMVGRKDATGTDWATPLEHTPPALARDLAVLRAAKETRRAGMAWTQATCCPGACANFAVTNVAV